MARLVGPDAAASVPAMSEPPTPRDADQAPLDVVIVGGGVAALEAALALRAEAGARVRLTILAPAPDFVYQPMAVLEPFVRRSPRHLPLADLAADVDATFVQDSATSVDVAARIVRTAEHGEIRYDALLIAVGARAGEVLENAIVVDIARMHESLDEVLKEIDGGALRSLALVAPVPTWPLPAYELALLLNEHARENGVALDVTVVTAEPRPLGAFGASVSAEVASVLAGAGVETIAGVTVEWAGGELIAQPGAAVLNFDRVVALPRLSGPAIAGLPADADGFLVVDGAGQVLGAERVYAAGDATSFPVKYGGIAAGQADAAAASIALLAGVAADPAPFDGVVHGFLMGGRKQPRRYFTVRIADGEAVAADASTDWTPGAKVGAKHLGPYLDQRWAEGGRFIAGPLEPPGARP